MNLDIQMCAYRQGSQVVAREVHCCCLGHLGLNKRDGKKKSPYTSLAVKTHHTEQYVVRKWLSDEKMLCGVEST